MGAFVDRSIRCIVRLDRKAPAVAGAVPIGKPFFSEIGAEHQQPVGGWVIGPPDRHRDGIKTWLICQHLNTTDRFVANYIQNRYFVVFDSHVFCHDCNENNILGGESAFLRMENESSALSDKELQAQIFEPFYEINMRFGGNIKAQRKLHDSRRTWRVCSHLADEGNFRRHVFDGNLILFAENNATCPDCLDYLLKGGCEKTDADVVLMPDDDFQYTIVDKLYSLNYELSLAQGFID